MHAVVVLEDAVEDVERARDFYERVAHGVGRYFVDSLWADVERLTNHHGVHSVHLGFHRMLASHFPFGIYYRETPERTEVFAVLDLRRDPSWIRKELGERIP